MRPNVLASEFSQLQVLNVSAPKPPLHHHRISAPPVRGLLRGVSEGRKLFLNLS